MAVNTEEVRQEWIDCLREGAKYRPHLTCLPPNAPRFDACLLLLMLLLLCFFLLLLWVPVIERGAPCF